MQRRVHVDAGKGTRRRLDGLIPARVVAVQVGPEHDAGARRCTCFDVQAGSNTGTRLGLMGHLWKGCCHCCDHDSCGEAEIMTSLPAACDTADGLITAMTAALAAPEASRPDAHWKDTIRAKRVDSPCWSTEGGGRGHESDPMYSSIKGKKVGWEHGRNRTSKVLHSTGTEHREAEQRIEPS